MHLEKLVRCVQEGCVGFVRAFGGLFQESAMLRKKEVGEQKLERTSLLRAEFFAFSKPDGAEPVEGSSMEGATNWSDMIA